MGFFTWIMLGGLAGWMASAFTGMEKRVGIFTSVFVGSVGAVVGGWVFGVFGGEGVTGFNPYSLMVAVVGAVICLTAMKAIVSSPEGARGGRGKARKGEREARGTGAGRPQAD